ncbi:MAG TPA: aldehyde dehydrogenase family protein, partial [Chloroflexota bacterium]|nr:aldehyde dehydrogenase family protein [Chloroflexota bacterium]
APLSFLRYYIGLSRDYKFEEIRTAGGTSIVSNEPVGVVGAIVPWNTPLLTTMAKVAPALATGCSVVLKPAPASPLNAYILAEALDEAGLPAGTFNMVPAGREAGEALVRHPDVDKIAFTGSTAAGKRIASLCSHDVKRVSLELGGKSAAIILEDANLEEVLPSLLSMSFANSGQMCVSKSRVLVPRSRSSEISDAFIEAAAAMKIGDPSDPDIRIGPLVTASQRSRVESYIAIGREEGAKTLLGGGRPPGLDRGWYVEPTVFVGVQNQMRIAREEIFGPVVSIIEYDTAEDAIGIANDSDFGLSGAVFTADAEKGIEVARKVRAGMYSVNGANQAANTPVGGFKQSGIGREVGPEAFQMYLETKSIAIPS